MHTSVQGFYDDLADDYHLVYADWTESIRRQAHSLDHVLQSILGSGRRQILDCSCGIGTQSLGLAQIGHSVLGSDISERAVQRARLFTAENGLNIEFVVADMRSLDFSVPGVFEVVISCDNSLPHLLTEADLIAAVTSIRSKLVPDGLFLASIRDYDAILLDRSIVTKPTVTSEGDTRRVVFQVWDWRDDGRGYLLNHMMCVEEEGAWTLRHRSTPYRAWKRTKVTQILEQCGFSDVRWLEVGDTSYFQPMVIARRKG